MKPFDLNLDAMCKRLSLANTRRSWRDIVARAEKEEWSYHDFLSTVIGERSRIAPRHASSATRSEAASRF